MADIFAIDGRTFNVGVLSVKRTARIPDGQNAGEAKDGTAIRDIYGTFYDYEITFGADAGFSRTDYDTLYEILSAPVDAHSVTVPYGQSNITFNATVKTVSDEIEFMDDNVTGWGNLSVSLSAKSPQRLSEAVVLSVS